MKKKLLITSILLSLPFMLMAEVDAGSLAILDEASALYRDAGDIEIKMKLIMRDEKTGNHSSTDGVLRNKKDKFVLDTEYAVMTYDGKDMYVYSPATEEITISAPERNEVENMDPMAVLDIYKSNYKIPPAETVRTKQGQCYSIDLFPEDIKSDVMKLNICIAVKDKSIKSVSTHTKNGVVNTIELKSIETDKDFPDEMFSFNPEGYPNAMVIDLR